MSSTSNSTTITLDYYGRHTRSVQVPADGTARKQLAQELHDLELPSGTVRRPVYDLQRDLDAADGQRGVSQRVGAIVLLRRLEAADGYLSGLRCAVGHSGNSRVVLDQGYVTCCGCRNWIGPEEALAVALDPGSDDREHGSGGLRTIPSAELREARRAAGAAAEDREVVS